MPRRKRILLAFGTRPEAIKMAPVHRALHASPGSFEPICCVTAQHRGLLDQALASFGIVPDIDLGLMKDGQQSGELGAAVLAGLTSVLADVRPDLVLVHGDTTTTTASALAAFYAGVPVGHVEAGLRSHTLDAPFPEEMNRRVTSLVARYHFAPTETGRANLLAEGAEPARVFVTGNTVVDALRWSVEKLDSDPGHAALVEAELDRALAFAWRRERFVLVTCHRREAFGGGIEAICDAVATLADAFPATRFVVPVHPNPQVRDAVARRLGTCTQVHLTAPLRYEACAALLRACHFVLTDSGGIQEEAPSFGKPVLVMREVTERPEAVAQGCAQLVGLDGPSIVAAAARLLGDPDAHAAMVPSANPYGDGRAAERIVAALRSD